MSYMVIDVETSIKLYKKRKASPFHPDNGVCTVIRKFKDEPTDVHMTPFYYRENSKAFTIGIRADTTVLVGINIKFDLLHMWHLPELQDFLKRGGKIWDCQYAEYLLTGQQQMYASMDEMAEKYGGYLKPDMVKAYWEQGIDTRDIPEDLLREYSIGDGDNTETIFLAQVVAAYKQHPKALASIQAAMDGLLATTEMEYNGLKIDQERGEELRVEQQEELEALTARLEEYIPTLPPELKFSWGSTTHRSALIFGGTVKYEKWVQHLDEDNNPLFAMKQEKWPLFGGVAVNPKGLEFDEATQLYKLDGVLQDTFKSGKRAGEGKTKVQKLPDHTKPKGAKQEFGFTFPGYTKPKPQWKSKTTDFLGNPLYSTSADVIDELGNRNIAFLKDLKRRMGLDKDIGTYYWKEDGNGNRKGMLTLVNEFDGLIHHSLNHVSTVTTRLSSSDPNLQNLPRKDKSRVKEVFISRFGEDGEVGEIDYSQLEVIIQGWLTEDENLRADILQGIDFHCKRLSQKLGEPYEVVLDKAKNETNPDYPSYSVQRTEVKGFSFQRAYGAGAEAISDATGMSVDDVKQLIEDERVLYPGIESFNGSVAEEVEASAVAEPGEFIYLSQGGVVPKKFGCWTSPTGRRYTFRQSEAPEFMRRRGVHASFSPPDMKNYPIQGTGGEVVQLVLGKLFRRMLETDRYGGKALLTNTVHDCVWFDYHKEVREWVLNDAIAIMQGIPNFLKEDFGIDPGVVFRVDAEYGTNMYDLHHFHSDHYIK